MLQPFMVPLRVLMLLGGGLLAVFGSEAIELGGAGPLAVVAAAFVSCYFWQQEGWEVDDVSEILRDPSPSPFPSFPVLSPV